VQKSLQQGILNGVFRIFVVSRDAECDLKKLFQMRLAKTVEAIFFVAISRVAGWLAGILPTDYGETSIATDSIVFATCWSEHRHHLIVD